MKNKFYFLILSFLFSGIAFSQSTGDTIVVKVLDYQKTTRDTMAHFPTDTALRFEKVIMRYAMRCKDARVSPPIAGRTNEGCGEWDYSCNTYLTDSSRVDSLRRSISQYVVYPDTNSNGLYSSSPTWLATPLIQTKVSLQSITNEDTISIGQGSIADSTLLLPNSKASKLYLLLSSSELSVAGLISGDIDGLSLENLGSSSNLYNLSVKIKASTLSNLDHFDSTDARNIQEVYFHNYTMNAGHNRIPFHTPFNWDGSSNLLVELSFKNLQNSHPIRLASHNTSITQSINSSDDISFGLFPNNYIEANDYYGIGGSGERTVEAWIKTAVADKEIVSWGRNSRGEKFSFRLEGAGRLRLEINSGFVIGTTSLNDNQWHHVALSFKGSTLNDVKFYVDGVLESISSISSIAVNTGQSLAVQISRGFHGRYWNGSIDDVRIWSEALPDSTLAKWRYQNIDSLHPNYNKLELNYTGENAKGIVIDQSNKGRDGEFKVIQRYNSLSEKEHFKAFLTHNNRPNVRLYQGNYTLSTQNDTITDTTYYQPYSVSQNLVFSKSGSINSDSLGINSFDYWPASSKTLDMSGLTLSSISSADTIRLMDSSLVYFQRSASKLEIMSFVTPYGINLDLGTEGEAWYFDVSDFTPILKGDKRLTLERGGQNQEEMDIQFLFIVGTPPRDVKNIQQLWRVDSRSYTQITNDEYFEPIDVLVDTTAKAFKIRSAITGHGQEGEFIPRNHFININGGSAEFNWDVWKACGSNPVFPQGGTWIYDRAGWCPGMATDVQEFDISGYIDTSSSSTVNIDYGVSTASGDSRYIVNNQLVSYGDTNFSLDARLTEVISPSNLTEYGRSNPVCDDVQIVLQNVGSTPLTAVKIDYWVNNGSKSSYTWSGNLAFLEETLLSIPTGKSFYSSVNPSNNTFNAEIESVNGITDSYSYNNKINSTFSSTEVFPANFTVFFTTNNVGSESSYDVRNDTGGIVFQRSNMANNTGYRDTFNLSSGCYSMNVYDSDGDGLSFFANSDGSGSIRLREVGGRNFKSFERDFGDEISLDFSIASTTEINEIKSSHYISIYPSPANRYLQVETIGLNGSAWEIYNLQGKEIMKGKEINSTFKLDVSGYTEGMYLIRFVLNGRSVSERFVVQH